GVVGVVDQLRFVHDNAMFAGYGPLVAIATVLLAYDLNKGTIKWQVPQAMSRRPWRKGSTTPAAWASAAARSGRLGCVTEALHKIAVGTAWRFGYWCGFNLSASNCRLHSAGASRSRAMLMPRGKRPSIASRTSLGARKASEMVMLT